MKSIIIIDNDKVNCFLTKELLFSQKDDNIECKIIANFEFCEEWIENKENHFDNIVHFIQEKATLHDTVHLLVDLLLTNDEEDDIDKISKSLREDVGDKKEIATGIQLANYVCERLMDDYDIRITFSSKWANLRNVDSIYNYNGIRDNDFWKKYNMHKIIKSIESPFDSEHNITNLEFSAPRYKAKSTIGVLMNVMFEDLDTEE